MARSGGIVNRLLIACCLVLALSGNSTAAEVAATVLELGSVSGPTGSQVTLPLVFKPGKGVHVSALGVDLSYDTSLLELPNVRLAKALKSDGAIDLIARSPAPGLYRFALIGLSGAMIEGGTVAEVTFVISSTAPKGRLELKMSPSGSTPEGKPVVVQGSNPVIFVE